MDYFRMDFRRSALGRRLAVLLTAGCLLLLVSSGVQSYELSSAYQPDLDLGELFHDVQTSDIFPDSKTFVDYRPKRDPGEIAKAYGEQKSEDDFDLAAFVNEHFDPPLEPEQKPLEQFPDDMIEHLNDHWGYLTREPDAADMVSSLIPLPHSYVVPGGRFREIYYWDSYFTMLGLAESGRLDLIEDMLNNFAYLIETVGFIPNGNRTYYLGRSQPPFFAAMVSLYGEVAGEDKAVQYLSALQKEYDFWMAGRDQLSAENPSVARVVRLSDGEVLNRYYDNFDRPRPEAYKEDSELAETLSEEAASRMYRDLRAAAESGWDFSTRWFEDGETFGSIVTTSIIPVDLNALLYNLEQTLARLYGVSGDQESSNLYSEYAAQRLKAVSHHLWDSELGTFRDLNFVASEFTPVVSLAMLYPLYFRMATQEQATEVARLLEDQFLFPGGFVSTLNESGQQWDYPNGWPPLQWLAAKGLMNYGFDELAATGAERWLAINEKIYAEEKKMMEKYNVTDTSLKAGGGEYPTQDGFGWTNGVALKLHAIFRSEGSSD